MPQASNVAIYEDAANTSLVTFKPKAVSDVAVFQDDTAVLASGRPSIKASHRLVTDTVAGRTRLTLNVPVEELIDGVSVVTRESTVNIDVPTAPGSSAAERTALRILASNLVLSTLAQSMIDDGEKVW